MSNFRSNDGYQYGEQSRDILAANALRENLTRQRPQHQVVPGLQEHEGRSARLKQSQSKESARAIAATEGETSRAAVATAESGDSATPASAFAAASSGEDAGGPAGRRSYRAS